MQPSEQRLLERHYYIDATVAPWTSVAFTVMFFGVLIHINLNYIIGVCILFLGAVMAAIIVVSGLFWPGLGLFEIKRYIAMRRITMITLLVIVGITLCFAVWAGVVMAIRAST